MVQSTETIHVLFMIENPSNFKLYLCLFL